MAPVQIDRAVDGLGLPVRLAGELDPHDRFVALHDLAEFAQRHLVGKATQGLRTVIVPSGL